MCFKLWLLSYRATQMWVDKSGIVIHICKLAVIVKKSLKWNLKALIKQLFLIVILKK